MFDIGTRRRNREPTPIDVVRSRCDQHLPRASASLGLLFRAGQTRHRNARGDGEYCIVRPRASLPNLIAAQMAEWDSASPSS
jgi:hypothetical protein